jgi:hypothetical protein
MMAANHGALVTWAPHPESAPGKVDHQMFQGFSQTDERHILHQTQNAPQ